MLISIISVHEGNSSLLQSCKLKQRDTHKDAAEYYINQPYFHKNSKAKRQTRHAKDNQEHGLPLEYLEYRFH